LRYPLVDGQGTSATSTAIMLRPTATPSSPDRVAMQLMAASTKARSTSGRPTMVRKRNRGLPGLFPTCSPMAQAALPSAWRPQFRRTTSAS
jgi:hypothetical protein